MSCKVREWRVTGADTFPEAPELGAVYVLTYRRTCEVVFTHAPEPGNWEVACWNNRGDCVWSVSTALWNSQTFGQAIREAREVSGLGAEEVPK